MCSKTHDFEKPIFPHFAVSIPFATWKRSKQCSKTVEKREINSRSASGHVPVTLCTKRRNCMDFDPKIARIHQNPLFEALKSVCKNVEIYENR